MEFKEGGAFDFDTTFQRLRERLRQAVDVARESGLASGDGADVGDGRGGGALSGVNMDNVHLEDLPAYEDSRADRVVSPQAPIPSPPVLQRDSVMGASQGEQADKTSSVSSPQQEAFSPPTEPPPGYEEVQQSSIADELERRLRNHDQDGG
jgi:hypothetical protein